MTGNASQKQFRLVSNCPSTDSGSSDETYWCPSEAKYIVRFLEGKLRLGLAEKTVLVSIAQAMICHEMEKKGQVPSTTEIEQAETTLKTVYRYVMLSYLHSQTNVPANHTQ